MNGAAIEQQATERFGVAVGDDAGVGGSDLPWTFGSRAP
jgi:hypothetical protein